jgi:hypothetical protein
VKGGSFRDNGVNTDAHSKFTTPLAGSIGVGKLSFTGVSFKSNFQGLMTVDGGSLEMTDCNFEDQGCVAKDAGNQSLACAFYAQGKSQKGEKAASIVVRRCAFTNLVNRLGALADGAELTMEDCQATNGKTDIVVVGGGAPCKVDMKKCKFSGFAGGLVLSAGSGAMLEDTELRGGKLGLEVRDSGTHVQLTNSIISKNELLALAVYGGAEVTARGCTFEENGYGGVQAGLPGKQDAGSAVVVDNCKFLNNQRMNARACPNARVIMKHTLFATGAQPMIYQDQGGVVESSPPVAVIAVNNPQQGPTVVPLPPKRTASNERVPSRPQPQRPSPSRQPTTPAGKVNEVLDVIDRVRRMVR